jgi:hypothetical protein
MGKTHYYSSTMWLMFSVQNPQSNLSWHGHPYGLAAQNHELSGRADWRREPGKDFTKTTLFKTQTKEHSARQETDASTATHLN